MKTHLTGRLCVAVALLAAPLALLAQTTGEKSEAPPPAAKQGERAEPEQGAAPKLSANVEELLKMVDAKVSPEVIKVFVENAPAATAPTAADIVALKEHAVPDDVTTALVKRSAEVREQTLKAGADSPGKGSVTAVGRPGAPVYVRSYGLDPESYEYFQHYYLHPRTLASVYQQLPPYYARSYGYSSPRSYGPYVSSGRSHRNRGAFGPPHGPRW